MADELVKLTDGTNTVDFLSGQGASTGYVKRNLEGLDPPPHDVKFAGGRPVQRKWQNREISITFGIMASSASDLANKQRAIITILENTFLYWESRGVLGARAQCQYRRPGGTNISYIDVYAGECDWGVTEHQQGAAYAYALEGAQLHLTCEPCFHPNATTNLLTSQTVYGHDDAAHNNYLDISAASIVGDIEAPIYLFYQANVDQTYALSIFRRTRGTLANFINQHEAEDATTQSNWPDAADTECSNGNKVSQGAGQTSGYIEWLVNTNMDDQRGWVHLFARLKGKTTTTTFRAAVNFGTSSEPYLYGKWIYPRVDNTFELRSLGRFRFPGQDPLAGKFANYRIRIEYSKADADVAECDFLHRMPDGESAMRLTRSFMGLYQTVPNYSLLDATLITLPYKYAAVVSSSKQHIAKLDMYSELKLKPGVDHRLYFHWTVDSNDKMTVLNGTTPVNAVISLDYLPQYLVPLE